MTTHEDIQKVIDEVKDIIEFDKKAGINDPDMAVGRAMFKIILEALEHYMTTHEQQVKSPINYMCKENAENITCEEPCVKETNNSLHETNQTVDVEALEALDNIKDSIIHEGIDYPNEIKWLETIRYALQVKGYIGKPLPQPPEGE